jgi:hypothetical protein
MTTFRMPHQRRSGAGRTGQWHRDRAGERAFRLPVDVLRPDPGAGQVLERAAAALDADGAGKEPGLPVLATEYFARKRRAKSLASAGPICIFQLAQKRSRRTGCSGLVEGGDAWQHLALEDSSDAPPP